MRSYFVARRSISGRKDLEMNKIVFADNQGFDIREGASTGAIVVAVADFTTLGTLADAITAPGNLDNVHFKTGETVTGEYVNMKLESPLFKAVDIVDGNVQATFSIRQKTEMELAIEELRAGQEVQDGAIGDLGNVVSGLAEGGAQ